MTHKQSADQQRAEIIAFNKGALLQAMKLVGLSDLSASYTGGGDSGNGYEIEPTPDNSAAMRTQVEVKAIRSGFNSITKEWNHSVVEETKSLEDAVADFCELLITQSGHDGWQNGEGGGGTLTLAVATGCCVLSHFDYVVEEDHSEHTF